ncbi:5048_t:CDS:2 [Entrophospora sp. SA101]|nr:5048_t:CDS:2 [Entrophospora sp. SA101]
MPLIVVEAIPIEAITYFKELSSGKELATFDASEINVQSLWNSNEIHDDAPILTCGSDKDVQDSTRKKKI